MQRIMEQTPQDTVTSDGSAALASTLSFSTTGLSRHGVGHGSLRALKTQDTAPRASRLRRLNSWETLLVADLVALGIGATVGLLLLASFSSVNANSDAHLGHNLYVALPYFVTVAASFALYGLYRRSRRIRPSSFAELRDVVHAIVMGTLMALGVDVGLHKLAGTPEIVPAQLAAIAICSVVSVPALRSLTHSLLKSAAASTTRVLVLGSGMVANQLIRHLNSERGIEVVGLVDNDPMPGTEVLGGVNDLPHLCRELNVDRVLVGFSRTHPSETVTLLRLLHGRVPISIVPRYFELLSWRSQIDELHGLPVIDVAPPELGLGARALKRVFDIVMSSVSLIVVSPLLVASAVAIKLTSPGPVFFRQRRIGRNGKPFTILKLRTMKVGADEERDLLRHANDCDGPIFKLRDDPRVTKVVRILRRTSIDELPQLLNVLAGKMSLVGPRPFVESESECIDGWAARRFEVRPGITGLWQVSGRNDLTYDELCRLDYLYVASWSLWWDLRILWHTPAAVLRARGAY